MSVARIIEEWVEMVRFFSKHENANELQSRGEHRTRFFVLSCPVLLPTFVLAGGRTGQKPKTRPVLQDRTPEPPVLCSALLQRPWKHHFNTSSSSLPTMTAANQRFNKTGSVEDLPCTGRPATVLTQERVDTNPRLSIRQGSIQAAINTSRYHAAMQKLPLKPYHPTLIVDLNEDDFDRRSEI